MEKVAIDINCMTLLLIYYSQQMLFIGYNKVSTSFNQDIAPLIDPNISHLLQWSWRIVPRARILNSC